MPQTRPHLLLITTDQQRYDALGLNGNPILQTPNLDALGARGVNFTRGYTTCPSCIAARRSILTGQFPATHGLVGYSEHAPFDPEFTLPGLLRDAGYQTQLVGKLHQQPQRRRFGFENMIMSSSPAYRPDSEHTRHNDYADWLREQGIRHPPNFHGISGNGRIARPWPLDEWYHQTTWVTSEAIRFLTETRDPSCPFFLHLSYWAPHPPLIPPKAYFDRYLERRGEWAPSIGSWVPGFGAVPPGIPGDSPTGPYRLDVIREAMAGYYGLINHIDDQIQRLMESYYVYMGPRSKDPLWIVFTSDHGELLGDHHLFRKSVAYEGSSHVPFFVSGRNVDLPQGSSDALVCLEDLLPTFCDLAGVKVPRGVDGRSLLPILRGKQRAVREELHGEHSGGNRAQHFMLHERYKYIWIPATNEEQLFDLQDDPNELEDISDCADVLEAMRKRMAKRLKGRKDYRYDQRKLRPCENRAPEALWGKA